MLSIRAEIGSMEVAGGALFPSRTMMTLATTISSIRCPSSLQTSRPQHRRQHPTRTSVAARATPPQPPVVRGAGGGGSGGPSDDDEDEERRRRSEGASPSSGGGGGGGSGSNSGGNGGGDKRSSTMSLQARVAADVLGVVHPARRNLTFSRALDSLTASALEAYCCGWTERDLDRELARAHARERDAPRPAVAASYVLLVWLTVEAAAEALSSSSPSPSPSSGGTSSGSSIGGGGGSAGAIGGGGDARGLAALGLSRWSRAPAVSEPSRRRWAGFAKLIVDAYYKKSWAWYPVEALALEMSAAAPAVEPRGRRRHEKKKPDAAAGENDEGEEGDSSFPSSPSSDDLIFASSPADVAEWARVVYATLDLLGRRGEGKRRF